MYVHLGNDINYRQSRKILQVQEKHVLIRHIRNLFVPPKKDDMEHDIVMLKFDEIKFTNNFRPICLPK